MKRGARPTAAAGIGAALLAIGGLAACSSASSTSGTAGGAPSASSSGPITIGVAMKTQQERRWAFDVKAMQEEAAKLGVKLIVQYANNDATTQASQIENLLSQNVSALIVTPVDSKAVASSAAQAKAAGVPVIAYDVGIQGTPIDYEVIRDNPQVGVLQAQAALQFAPSGNYALVEGDAANDVAQAIHGSHVTVLHGQKPEVVYDKFTANWDPNTALSEAENILSANNDQVSAFLTANDGMASSVVQALKARKLAGKVFVSGLDANPQNLKFVDQGFQTMTVWTQIDKQGQIAVDVATQLAKGQKPQADTQIDNGSGQQIPARVAPVVAITKKNLCDFVNHIAPAGWVTAADAFVNPSDCPAS
jgi:D-xylose transport system substrate-binding protein